MRILLFTLILVSAFSCTKEKVIPTNSLIGTWTWDSTFSGWGGLTESSPQNYQELRFTDNTHYLWTKNDDTLYQGNYTLNYVEDNWYSGQPEWVLEMDKGVYSETYIVHQSSDSLVLQQMAADGSTHAFHL